MTTLAVFDAGTGIQRVVREITHQLGHAHGLGARVEPVRTNGGVATLAREFGRSLYGVPDASPLPLRASFRTGDVSVCLDLNVHDRAALSRSLQTVRAGGGRAVVVIYDLLPVLTPQHFQEPVQRAFPLWLELIAREADGLLCISRTVADEVLELARTQQPGPPQGPSARHRVVPSRVRLQRGRGPRAVDRAAGAVDGRHGRAPQGPCRGAGRDGASLAHGRRYRPADRGPRRLAYGGAAGTAAGPPRGGPPVAWLSSAGDEQVSALYRRSAALLMASEGEGFGLPIVEAAHAGLPVIARDIPVFREICGDSAVFFTPGKLGDGSCTGWRCTRQAACRTRPASSR